MVFGPHPKREREREREKEYDFWTVLEVIAIKIYHGHVIIIPDPIIWRILGIGKKLCSAQWGRWLVKDI